MNHASYSERLDYLLELIETGSACSPVQLAKKFNCCEKTARNLINTLREKGYDINYCRYTQKYFLRK
jgi:biotin operon repressor